MGWIRGVFLGLRTDFSGSAKQAIRSRCSTPRLISSFSGTGWSRGLATAMAPKAGKSAQEIWPDQPSKAAQKDVNPGWTLKVGGKIGDRPDGKPLLQIALPVFGYKSHISIDRRYGFVRESAVTSAGEADGRMLKTILSKENTAGDVWADSVYRSQSNEKWLGKNGFVAS